MCILYDHGKGTPQVIFPNIFDVDPIICDLSRLNIIKPVDEVYDRCLSGTR